MGLVDVKIEKISKILEKYPEDRVSILQDLSEICRKLNGEREILDGIESYFAENVPLIYYNPTTVQIYAEILNKSLSDMFREKDELLEEFGGTFLVEGILEGPLIRFAIVEKRNSLGMDIETGVVSDGIADIYELAEDFYCLDFADTASWLGTATYVDGELYGTDIYSRYKFNTPVDNYNCYAVDNILPFETKKIIKKGNR